MLNSQIISNEYDTPEAVIKYIMKKFVQHICILTHTTRECNKMQQIPHIALFFSAPPSFQLIKNFYGCFTGIKEIMGDEWCGMRKYLQLHNS